MQKDRLCVAYYTVSLNEQQRNAIDSEQQLINLVSVAQRAYFKDFVRKFESSNQTKLHVTQSFYEDLNDTTSKKWTKLQEAIDLCRKTKAYLLISELGNKSTDEEFSKMLCNSEVDFACCDQPLVTKDIIQALSKHEEIQRKIQDNVNIKPEVIKTTKVGNPNAAKLINKLNQPKVHAAIIYASFLQILGNGFKKQKFSQRKIVQFLNENDFNAPEGGKWVLSQLQKVIDRGEWTEKASELKVLFEDLNKKDITKEKICEELNRQQIKSVKNKTWDLKNLKLLDERINIINKILVVNKVISLVDDIVEIFNAEKLSPKDLVFQFSNLNLELCKDFKLSEVDQNSANTKLMSKLKQIEDLLKSNDVDNKEVVYFIDVLKDVVKHITIYTNNIAPHIEKMNQILSLEAFGGKNLGNMNLPLCLESTIEVINKFKQSNLITIDMIIHAIQRISKQPSILREMVVNNPKSTVL